MNTEEVKTDLDRLVLYKLRRQKIVEEKAELVRSLIPPDIQEKIDDVEAEFDGKLETADKHISQLEDKIRVATLLHGETIKTNNFQAVYNSGRISWNTPGLNKLSKRYPEIGALRTDGQPYIQLRAIVAKDDE